MLMRNESRVTDVKYTAGTSIRRVRKRIVYKSSLDTNIVMRALQESCWLGSFFSTQNKQHTTRCDSRKISWSAEIVSSLFSSCFPMFLYFYNDGLVKFTSSGGAGLIIFDNGLNCPSAPLRFRKHRKTPRSVKWRRRWPAEFDAVILLIKFRHGSECLGGHNCFIP